MGRRAGWAVGIVLVLLLATAAVRWSWEAGEPPFGPWAPTEATIGSCGGVSVTTDEGDRTVQWYLLGGRVPDEWQGRRTVQGEFRRRLDKAGQGEFRSGDISVVLSAGTIECE
jgi:hypothetical protein